MEVTLNISTDLSLPVDYVTKTVGVLAQRRKGKRLWVGTPMPTPTGWTTMGDVAVGDWLFDDQGRPCTVVDVTEIVEAPAWRVTFSDGSSLLADGGHLWRTSTSWEAWVNKSAIRTTDEIRATLDLPPRSDGRAARRHRVAVAGSLELPDVILPIDPYVLGAWLGDGTSVTNVITSADPEVIDHVRAAGYPAHVVPSTAQRTPGYRVAGLLPQLRAAKLLGNKHVPAAYLRGSHSQRLALLQGLMDTDGEWAKANKQAMFTSTNEGLSDAVAELVVSLGMKATRSKRPARLYGVDHGVAYTVRCSPTEPVFRLSRKADQLRLDLSAPGRRRRTIVAVDPAPVLPMRCIAVDSPSRLFLAGQAMVPTHNTYTASVIAEEFVAAGLPFVALDPTGAWWGLRASSDGSGPGLPVTILGGEHGDVPLERGDGAGVAELVVDEPGWYVIDLGLFESNAAEVRFATDFAQRLYRRKGQPNSNFPMHLFVDEADRFVPQRPAREKGEGSETSMLGAFEAIVRRGGLRGLGTTLISQRSAVVNKNVLEQVDVLVVLRTVGPNDRQRIIDIVSAEGTPEQIAEIKSSMASLDLGEAWFWEPGEALFQRIRVRARHTFNSSATPKPGEKRIEPRQLAPVDLEAIKDRWAASIDKAKENDPAELRKRLKATEHELAWWRHLPSKLTADSIELDPAQRWSRWGPLMLVPADAVPENVVVQEVEVRIETQVVPKGALEAARVLRDHAAKGAEAAESMVAALAAVDTEPKVTRSEPAAVEGTTPRTEQPPKSPKVQVSAPPARDTRAPADFPIYETHRRILAASRDMPDADAVKHAFLAGYNAKTKSYTNALGQLRSAGYLDGRRLTEAGERLADDLGIEAAVDPWEHWYNHPKVPPLGRRVLDRLREQGPQEAWPLASFLGYGSVKTKSFTNIVGLLRGLGLVTKGWPVALTEQMGG